MLRQDMNILLANFKAAVLKVGYKWVIFTAIFVLVVVLLEGAVGLMSSASLVFLLWWDLEGVGSEESISFFLPRYRESLRIRYFAGGALIGLAFALWLVGELWLSRDIPDVSSDLPLFSYRYLGSVDVAVTAVSAFLAGMTASVGASVLRYSLSRSVRIITLSFVPLVGLILVFPGLAFKNLPALWYALLPIGVLLCIVFWLRLGDIHYLRQGHRLHVLWSLDWRINTGAGAVVLPWVEEWFHRRMERHGFFRVERHLWAEEYIGLGPLLSRWRWAVGFLVAGVLILGYVNSSLVGLAFLLLGTIVSAAAVPAEPTMLLPVGRRQRYYASVVMALVALSLLIVTAGAAIGLSWILAALMPAIPLGKHGLHYAGMSLRDMWLACLPLPWFLLFYPRGHRMPIVRTVAVVLVALLTIGEIFFRDYDFYDGPTLLPALLACGWAFFLLTAWITYTRRDLVGQRPRRDG